MKRLFRSIPLFFLIFSLISKDSRAQVTLTSIEDFNIGDSLEFYITGWSGMGTGPSGSNVTWDYHALVVTDSSTEKMVSAASTAYAADFPTANLVEKYSDGSFVFIEKDATYNKVWGTVTNTGIEIKYLSPTPYIFIKRPFTYLDSIVDTSHLTFSASGTNNGIQYSKTISDGWGKLILPGQTYNNVLRIRFEQVAYDTAVSSTTITTVISKTYAWFEPMHKSALMKVDSVIISNPFYHDTSATVRYLKNELRAGIRNEQITAGSISGLIINGTLLLDGNITIPNDADVQVYNINGQQLQQNHVANLNGKQNIPLKNNVPPGVYMVRILFRGAYEQYVLKVVAR